VPHSRAPPSRRTEAPSTTCGKLRLNMAGSRYPITDAVFETPRYGPRPRGSVTPIPVTGPTPHAAAMATPQTGEHDLLGDGWVEVVDGSLLVAIRPRGIVGHIEPKEKRSYELSSVVDWHVSANVIEVTFGSVGQVASNGAEGAAHLGKFKLSDREAAAALTAEANAAGMSPRQRPTHSGI
jgi:hypothetical protein